MTDEMTTPPTADAPATAPPPAPAKQPGKWRVVIPLVVIFGFLGVVLWAVRDNQSADDLAIGTCFDVPTGSSISTVTKHACTEAHDAEVFHNATYPDNGSYPITLTFSRYATDTCGPVFGTYVGEPFEDNEDLDVGFFYPTSDSWASGDRTVTCYVHRSDDAKLTKSVKGSAST
jgi:hypothetical protein